MGHMAYFNFESPSTPSLGSLDVVGHTYCNGRTMQFIFSEGLILGLDFAAGSWELCEFFVFFHELHELSVYFMNCVHCW
jgi:hypothetical protein